MQRIVIADYGMGNLRSVQKAIEKIGSRAEISDKPEDIASADKLILPGVGGFHDAMIELRHRFLIDPICEHIAEGYPFLGICLGLELLFTRSHEDGLHPGLDIIPGEVVAFCKNKGLKVPHMGWNPLQISAPDCPLFQGIENGDAVYFVHSYYSQPLHNSITAATAAYPTPFTAAIWQDHIYATQFHPEKSQGVGLRILKNFIEKCN